MRISPQLKRPTTIRSYSIAYTRNYLCTARDFTVSSEARTTGAKRADASSEIGSKGYKSQRQRSPMLRPTGRQSKPF